MTASTLFISPRLAVQKGDFLGSGVPYWPLEAAIFAATLRERGWQVDFWDLFGLDPFRLESDGLVYWQGLRVESAASGKQASYISSQACIFVYAISAMSHPDLLKHVRWLRASGARKIVVLENSQAVTGYDISLNAADFRKAGAHYLIVGEPYSNGAELESFFLGRSAAKPANVVDLSNPASTAQRLILDPLTQPIPAWDLLPYHNYWKLPYAHGPRGKTYFPMLSSRGCPYPCTFCTVPVTNNQRWRPRSPEEVVAEMKELHRRFGVTEFHWEDLNPTIDGSRIQAIARLLEGVSPRFHFRLVSGTKAETLDPATIDALARAGCDYLSISPESGSPGILKKMGKPFNHAGALETVGQLRQKGVSTQACFVLGYPEESADDRRATTRYMREMVRAGVGEVAFFILSPLPGSALYKTSNAASGAQDVLSFSPRHRADYADLDRWRRQLIRQFLQWKIQFHSLEFGRQILNALRSRPRTKMEMLPRRMLAVTWMRMNPWK